MKYRHLGRTGLKVSCLSIGGWLTLGSSIGHRRSQKILHTAIDKGVNFIDLADVYGKGEAERVVGELIPDYPRRHLVISSKAYWPMSQDPNDQGLSRKHLMESVEGSLKRLGTDYLDIYFCHRWDSNTPLLETMRAMDDLIRSGKIHYWGTSMWSADQLQRAKKVADDYQLHPPVVEQPRYNLLHRDIEKQVMPTASELGMGLTVWSPLAQGILTGKYNDTIPEGSRGDRSDWLGNDLTRKNLDRTRQFCELAEDAGLPAAQLALAWILEREEISSVITGASRVEHVEQNLGAATMDPDPDLVDRIDELFSQ